MLKMLDVFCFLYTCIHICEEHNQNGLNILYFLRLRLSNRREGCVVVAAVASARFRLIVVGPWSSPSTCISLGSYFPHHHI